MRSARSAPLRFWLAVSFAGLAVSCSGSTKKTSEPTAALVDAGPAGDAGPDQHIPTLSGPARLVEGRYFVNQGAPDPLACAEDKDCIGDTVPDETGCCVRSSDAHPQTFAWHAWVTKRRLSIECDKVKCPPLPVPSAPEECRLKAACASGKCRDSCAGELGKEPEQQKH